MELCLAINRDYQTGPSERPSPSFSPDLVRLYGVKGTACSHSCPWRCALIWRNIPGKACPGVNTTMIHCVAGLFVGSSKFYNWNLQREMGVEVNSMANKLGLNHWLLLIGMVPWLRECKEKGLLEDFGVPIELEDSRFWVTLLQKIAFREGIGDVLAEDVPRAADRLGWDKETRKFYPAHGFAGHWDSHGDKATPVFFPLWVVSVLRWLTDSRGPFSSGHDYSQNLTRWSRVFSWDKLSQTGEKIYGSRRAVDPSYPYEYKAQPAI